MTHRKRKLPTCATCGKTLAFSRERIQIRYSGIPGAPSVGAHLPRCEADPTFQGIFPGRGQKIEALIAGMQEIAARGTARVAAGPAWWQLLANAGDHTDARRLSLDTPRDALPA